MENKFSRGVEIVVGIIIENSDGKILLTKSPKWRDKWVIPGGHIEPGEKIEDAGLREAKEEVGMDLKSSGIISCGEIIDSQDFHRPAHFVYFDILCKTENTEVKIDDDEIREYKWVLPEEALKMDLGSGARAAIKDYLKTLEN